MWIEWAADDRRQSIGNRKWCEGTEVLKMGWDGMGWEGMGWDGMGWDGMGYHQAATSTRKHTGSKWYSAQSNSVALMTVCQH